MSMFKHIPLTDKVLMACAALLALAQAVLRHL